MFSGSAKVYKNKVYIPMIIYVVMTVISYMAADYKYMAAVGFFERYENTFVLIGYMAITFYAMNMINDERAFKLIFYIFSGCCAVLGIWGILQTLGIDIYNLPGWLYMNSEISQMSNFDAINNNLFCKIILYKSELFFVFYDITNLHFSDAYYM